MKKTDKKAIVYFIIIFLIIIAVITFVYNKYFKNSYTMSDLTNFGNEPDNKYYLSATSLMRLNNVKPILIDIFKEAIKQSPYDFGIASGFRTLEEQQKLYAKGRTTSGKIVTNADGIINKSYHQSGNAVDIYAYINGKATWESQYYKPIAEHIMKVAKEKFNTNLQWGGNWTKFRDLPHFQI
jgi:peptidoglycan L-alanyl-D-glutamate endopeptidase CwlK